MNRWILFATDVGKGTISGFLCVLSMLLQALGIEIINEFYVKNQPIVFGAYCAGLGLAYIVFLWLARLYMPKSIVD
jgi:hypothetical protein